MCMRIVRWHFPVKFQNGPFCLKKTVRLGDNICFKQEFEEQFCNRIALADGEDASDLSEK